MDCCRVLCQESGQQKGLKMSSTEYHQSMTVDVSNQLCRLIMKVMVLALESWHKGNPLVMGDFQWLNRVLLVHFCSLTLFGRTSACNKIFASCSKSSLQEQVKGKSQWSNQILTGKTAVKMKVVISDDWVYAVTVFMTSWYDMIWRTILTCAQKLTSSQLSLPHRTKQKRIMKKLKT